MAFYYSDESKAPRACDHRWWWHADIGFGAFVEWGDGDPSACHPPRCECNGTGRINDGAQADVEVEPFKLRSVLYHYRTWFDGHWSAWRKVDGNGDPMRSEPLALAAARKATGVRS